MAKASRIVVKSALAGGAILAAFAAGSHWLPARPVHAQTMAAGMMDHHAMAGHRATPVAAAAVAPNEVIVDNFAFGPATLTVAAGTKVTWINRDEEAHLVAASGDKPLFKSPPLDTNDKFSFVFKQPGTYAYFCLLHPFMQGIIIVR